MVRVLCVLCVMVMSSAAVAKPQSNWVLNGLMTYPNSVLPSEKYNLKGEFTLTRNYIWVGPADKGTWIVYGSVFGLRDSDLKPFNSKQKFILGAKVKYRLPKGQSLSVGLRYEVDNRDLANKRYYQTYFRADYNVWRRLKNVPKGKTRVLNGWTTLRYPGGADDINRQNWVGEGRYELYQVLKKTAWAGDAAPALIGFGGAAFVKDTKGLSYNSKLKLDAGLRLKWKWGKSGSVSLNGRYTFDHRWKEGLTHEGPSASLSVLRRF